MNYHLIIWSLSASLFTWKLYQVVPNCCVAKQKEKLKGWKSSDTITTGSRQELRTRSNESVEKTYEDNQPLNMNQSGSNNLKSIITSGHCGPMLGLIQTNTNYDARTNSNQDSCSWFDILHSVSLKGREWRWVQLICIKFLHICSISNNLIWMLIKFIATLDHYWFDFNFCTQSKCPPN